MNKKYSMTYLDKYICGKDLSSEELDLMTHYPLKVFAYRLEGCSDFELIRDRLVSLREKVYKGWCFKEVCYILSKTGLKKHQQIRLRGLYILGR